MNPSDTFTPPFNDSYLKPGPIRASRLAETEASRRDRLARFQPVKYGCPELDSAVLLGGLQRGSIVGISADDADGFGLLLGLQGMIRSILEGSVNHTLVITPKPLASISKLIAEIAKSELSNCGFNAVQIQNKCRAVLDSVLLSVVFDIDGIRQTLSELLQPLVALASLPTAIEKPDEMPMTVAEIQDSKDKDVSQSVGGVHVAPPQKPSTPTHETRSARSSGMGVPEIIVVTHFSSLLGSLFATREKTEAHRSLAVLRGQLHRLAHSSSTRPLLLLVNSTTEAGKGHKESTLDPSNLTPIHKSPEHMPRSIFSSVRTLSPSRPSFGVVFNQFLDLHLLCTCLPECQASASFCVERTSISTKGREGHSPTLVEVLQDDLGLPSSHFRKHQREQRWAVLSVSNQRIVNVSEI